MSIHDILQDIMVRNIWCSPMQDYQYTFKPKRVTDPKGISGYFDVPEVYRGRIDLPTTDRKDRYIVYQIGAIFNDYVSLPDVRNVWLNARGIIGFNNIMIDIYNSKGLSCPRYLVWCYMTDSNNVLLAVKRNAKVDPFVTDDLYLRLYTNAFFKSPNYNATVDGMECAGDTITSSEQAASLQQTYLNMLDRKGNTMCWVNGIMVHEIDQRVLVIGDCVDMVWDSSINKVIDFKVSDLPTFHSNLDLKDKYLLHPNKSWSTPSIEYYDDIDIYVCNVKPNDLKGVYLYRHQQDTVRMLTHRDYAVPTLTIDYMIAGYDYWNNINDATLRMFFREETYDRSLGYESSRIANLYELSDDQVMDAMTGVDSLIPEWSAAGLESSPYVEAMRRPNRDMDQTELQNLYGYHGVVKYLSESFHTFEAGPLVDVPTSLQTIFTAYEYDVDGLYLGRYVGEMLYTYPRQNANAFYVELISGKGSNRVFDTYNQDTVTLSDAECIYRVYRSPLLNGAKTNTWEDITKSSRVTLSGTTVSIANFDVTHEEIYVREDTNHYAQTLTVTELDEVIELTLNSVYDVAGTVEEQPSMIPYLNITVILNGHTLVRDIEYVLDWPRLTIISSEYRDPSGTNTILIRGKGLPTGNSMSILPYKETGFTDFGYLSRNGIYNIRDDYALKYVMNGRVYRQTDLNFGDLANTPVVSGYPDSRPYYIQDFIQSIRGLAGTDSFEFYLKSLDFTVRVENYLSEKFPEPDMSLKDNRYIIGNPQATVNSSFDPAELELGTYTTKYFLIPSRALDITYSVSSTLSVLTDTQRWGIDVKGLGTVIFTTPDGVTKTIVLTDVYQRVDLPYVAQSLTQQELQLTMTYQTNAVITVRGLMNYEATTARPYNLNGDRVFFDAYQPSSPLMTKVYHDLRSGVISRIQVDGVTSDTQVMAYLKDTEYLKESDPTTRTMDPRHVSYLCFPKTSDVRYARQSEINFLNRVSSIYFQGIYHPADELTLVTGA